MLPVLVSILSMTMTSAYDDQTPYGNLSESISPVFIFQNTCIADLGCFYNGPPFFHPILRPVIITPKNNMTAQYLVFTKYNPQIAHRINLTESSVADSPIDSNWPTKILIHGFVTKLEENDSRYSLKDELLKHGSYNVIIIDWTEHNGRPYTQAVGNGRVIGAKIAKLIKIFEKVKKVKQEHVHIIGHSLGAHVAGWVGERLESLGRISGLDPAGPFFHNAPSPVKLDWTDATFVDIIHTNGASNLMDGLGLQQAIGHIDFYPNGGKRQPGCHRNVQALPYNASENFEHLVANSCDHSRAFDYYISSISKCLYLGIHCKDYSTFKTKNCSESSTTAVMGFHAEKNAEIPESSTFYLETNNALPFCAMNDTIMKKY